MMSDTTANSSALYEWLIESVHRLDTVRPVEGPAGQWLEDIRVTTDMECTCVLQGKSLTRDTTDVIFTTHTSLKDTVDTIKGRAHVISTEFSKLFKRLEKDRWKHIRGGALRITYHIRSMLHECNNYMANPPQSFIQYQQEVMAECAKLAQFVESNLEGKGVKPDKTLLTHLLTCLGQSFSSLVDSALRHMVKGLLHDIEKKDSDPSLRAALNNLLHLALDGDHMCYLISSEGGVKALFSVCQTSNRVLCHSQAYRVMATLCCVTESIIQLEEEGGISSLSEVLSEPTTAESIRAEAAGVIAQITSPALDHYQHLGGFLEHMDDLVRALTALCVEASNHEVFLLGSAALANITFMDPLACDFLLNYHTASVLIEACQLNKDKTLFAKDQVATVLANMAAMDTCSPEIIKNGGLELLVQFLNQRSPRIATEAEQAACERVQQKAAIALARLSRDEETAQHIINLKAIPRLVELCKVPQERHKSDAVLVAALAALRKICSICEMEAYNNMDLKQLIQPKLMDSFLYCSGLEESYV